MSSFWATLTKMEGVGKYVVVDSKGLKHDVEHSQLRLRKWKAISCCCVSDDKVHDRFANNKFGQLEKAWIINYLKETHVEDNVLFGGELAYLHTHFDNAAQHFKSTGALEAYAALWFKRGRPTLSTYHFGCPGHGKGPWDGIGGWLKNSLHTMVKGAQSSLQNLPGLKTCALTCAYDVYLVFKETYDCPKWRDRISTSTTAKLMHIHFIPCVSDVMSPELRYSEKTFTIMYIRKICSIIGR
jgi:hypothetical protein